MTTSLNFAHVVMPLLPRVSVLQVCQHKFRLCLCEGFGRLLTSDIVTVRHHHVRFPTRYLSKFIGILKIFTSKSNNYDSRVSTAVSGIDLSQLDIRY